jgi:hypothetical protein
MKAEQELCEAAVEVLVALRVAEGLPGNLQLLAKHATEALARPSMLVAPEDFVQRGPKIMEGVLLLRLRSDGDAEPVGTSVGTVDDAARHLVLEGKAALKEACQARGVWLRTISLQGGQSDEEGDRWRSYEQRLKVWIQTSL